MTQTTESYEREVEMKRANVEATLDRLKSRTSIDKIADDIGQYLHLGDARDMLRTAGDQVRQNPVAIGLVAAGLGWLMLGGSGSSGRTNMGRSGTRDDWGSRRTGQSYGAQGDADDHGMAQMARDAADSMSHTAHGLAGRVSSAMHDASGSVRSTVDAASGAIADSTAGMARQARDMTDEVSRQVQGHPLLTGAAFAVIGAVIGAALPKSDAERSLLHSSRRKILDEGQRVAADMGQRASDAAARTVQATRRAAEHEGLWPTEDGRTLGEKLGNVAEVAVDEAKASIDPVLTGDAAGTETGTDAGDKDTKTAKSKNRL